MGVNTMCFQTHQRRSKRDLWCRIESHMTLEGVPDVSYSCRKAEFDLEKRIGGDLLPKLQRLCSETSQYDRIGSNTDA